MEKYNDEQTKVQAGQEQDLAGQEPEKNSAESTAVSFGKFKDANALLSAYNALEAEFTKRCQKVKELESRLSAVDKVNAPTPTETQTEPLTEQEKDDILKEYLKDVLSKKQRAIVLDGTGIGAKTPLERPKTLEQAGQLAKEILKKSL